MTLLRPATLEDIPFIMATERLPGYEDRIGRWSHSEHRACLVSPNYAYLIGSAESGEATAFAIIQDREEPHGNLHLRRIAVIQEGQGLGRQMLAAVIDWAFHTTDAHRFWLEVLETNLRAQRLYLAQGFRHEGTAREGYRQRDGCRCDFHTMSILRREWQAREASPRRAAPRCGG